jgi:hypothetical protein
VLDASVLDASERDESGGDMASGTVTTERRITLPAAADVAAAQVQAALAAAGGTPATDPTGISAKFGSQVLLRLVGGWFIPASKFPMKATASLVPTTGGTEVVLHVADAMGIGVKAGIRGKYERGVGELADSLAARLAG